jgi:hypothetical protein
MSSKDSNKTITIQLAEDQVEYINDICGKIHKRSGINLCASDYVKTLLSVALKLNIDLTDIMDEEALMERVLKAFSEFSSDSMHE